MARELSEKDRDILLKLVPELKEMTKLGIDLDYRNILPPVANHYSRDEKDFEQRLKGLSVDDMRYLVDLVFEGKESTGCISPEFAEVFFVIAGQRLSEDVADKLREVYESGGDCCG